MPGREVPGYQARRLALLDFVDADGRPHDQDRLAHHLVQYVIGTISHDEALAQIMDMDSERYLRVIAFLLGGAGGEVSHDG